MQGGFFIKVGLLNDSFPPKVDGVANTVLNYATIINEKYGESVVITPKYPKVKDRYPFEVYRYPSVNVGDLIPYRVGNPFFISTVLDLKKKNFDILHVHSPFASSVLAREISLSQIHKKRCPTVFTYHTKFDIDFEKFLHNDQLENIAIKFIKNNISLADEVWAVSNGAIKSLRKIGYDGDVTVMPNGTDFKKGTATEEQTVMLKNKYGITNDDLVFIFCGRMMWYKNIRIIIDCLSLIKQANIKFKMFFIGDGVDFKDIKKYSDALGLNENVIYTGVINDREELRTYFSISDLMLFPSTFDTSGLVVKEAAACACPAALTINSCAAEGATHLQNAILANENPESLAKEIISVIRIPNKLKELGQNAQNELYLSWEDSVADAYKRYEKLI